MAISTPGSVTEWEEMLKDASPSMAPRDPHFTEWEEMLKDASPSMAPRDPHFAAWAILFSGVAAVIIATLGFFGNLLTFLALPFTQRLRNAATWFVLNLAFAEGIFCVTILPMCAAHLFHLHQTGEPLFSDDGCRAFVFLRYVNIYVELFSIAAIAVNRCVLIANPKLYQSIFTDRKTVGYIVAIWLLPILMMMIPLTGVYGEFAYNRMTKECDFADRTSSTPRRVFLLLGLFVPCVIIISSYSYIFFKVRKSSARIIARSSTNKIVNSINNRQQSMRQQQPPAKGLSKRDIRIARTIGIIFIVYLVCCTPVSFMHFYDKEVKYPNLLLLLHPLYWLQYCLNIFIYVFMNKQYRDAYINYIAAWWPDFKAISIRKFRWAEEVSEFTHTQRKSTSTIRQSIFNRTDRRTSSSKTPSSPTLLHDQQL